MMVLSTAEILVFIAFIGAQTVAGQSWMTQTGTVEFISSVPFFTFTGTSQHIVDGGPVSGYGDERFEEGAVFATNSSSFGVLNKGDPFFIEHDA